MRTLVITRAGFRDRFGGLLEKILRSRLDSALIRIEYTRAAGEGTRLAYKAAMEGVDVVVAFGGDGTVNEVVNGIVGTGTALGIMPAGTANDLATLCRIPSDPSSCCDIIRGARTVDVDVIGVNGKYYATTGGIGVPAEVVKTISAARDSEGFVRCLAKASGRGIYLFAAVAALGKRCPDRPSVTVRWDGGVMRTRPLSLMFNNQAFLGGRFLMSPNAAHCDGLGDVCLIEEPGGRLSRLSVLPRVLRGSHVRLPWVREWRARGLVIESEAPIDYMGDGELLATERVFYVKIHPSALKVIVPEPRRGGQLPPGRAGVHDAGPAPPGE